MKAFLLPALLCGAALLTGCETVAVVDHSPVYGRSVVYYDSGRPYYYNAGVRYWGYPYGYGGGHHSYTHVDVDREVTRNTYVDRRTVYRGNQGHHYDSNYHHPQNGNYHRSQSGNYYQPHVGGTTIAKPQTKQTTGKKKKNAQDRDHTY